MASEFALIRRHFTRPARHTDLSVGDDAALIRPAAGMQLAISTDMLVAGTHFFADTDPRDLGWKTLAVNVSDLAAMGAQPRWVVLAASLPRRRRGLDRSLRGRLLRLLRGLRRGRHRRRHHPRPAQPVPDDLRRSAHRRRHHPQRRPAR